MNQSIFNVTCTNAASPWGLMRHCSYKVSIHKTIQKWKTKFTKERLFIIRCILLALLGKLAVLHFLKGGATMWRRRWDLDCQKPKEAWWLFAMDSSTWKQTTVLHYTIKSWQTALLANCCNRKCIQNDPTRYMLKRVVSRTHIVCSTRGSHLTCMSETKIESSKQSPFWESIKRWR